MLLYVWVFVMTGCVFVYGRFALYVFVYRHCVCLCVVKCLQFVYDVCFCAVELVHLVYNIVCFCVKFVHDVCFDVLNFVHFV